MTKKVYSFASPDEASAFVEVYTNGIDTSDVSKLPGMESATRINVPDTTRAEAVLARDYVSEAAQIQRDRLAAIIRAKRTALLREVDHWFLSDRTPSVAQVVYRQALRDVPQQEGFPEQIMWPKKPKQ